MSARLPEVFAAILVTPRDLPRELKLEIASEFYSAPRPVERITVDDGA